MDPQRWGDIERLYHLAREREIGDREKFLAEACGGNESLRQEVESLLARPPEGQDFLEAPVLAWIIHEWKASVRRFRRSEPLEDPAKRGRVSERVVA